MTYRLPEFELRRVNGLKPYGSNARTHSREQINQIARSVEEFGFTNPVLIGDDDEIIAGHGRVRAARQLGMQKVPTLRLSHLTKKQRRAYVIADNKLALNAGWDTQTLAIELQALIDLEFDVSVTGFSVAEIDLTMDQAREADVDQNDKSDHIPQRGGPPVSCSGDVWQLGRHVLLCGDARSKGDVDLLMGDEQASLVFTAPPYNVPVDGHVCGLGSVHHRDFAFASGEMSKEQFTGFLTTTLSNAASVCRDGAIAFVCMDWRHMSELLEAGSQVFSQLKNLCVWNKTNGGMGSFYRSKHELVFVFKVGTAPHTNNFGLGETGRYRTNVWDYAGVSSAGSARLQELEMHPTVKPVAMIGDAIKDCSKRGEIVLDLFAGSGSTLIAAEATGRLARVIEYDAGYCDTIIARWQQYTGRRAILGSSGLAFEDVSCERLERLAARPALNTTDGDEPTHDKASAHGEPAGRSHLETAGRDGGGQLGGQRDV